MWFTYIQYIVLIKYFYFCLQSEKVKQVLQQARYRPLALNDPYSALFRDSVTVCVGNSKYSHTVESDHRPVVDQQMESLENLVLQQRQTQLRMAAILKDAEEKHKKVTFLMKFFN